MRAQQTETVPALLLLSSPRSKRHLCVTSQNCSKSWPLVLQADDNVIKAAFKDTSLEKEAYRNMSEKVRQSKQLQ